MNKSTLLTLLMIILGTTVLAPAQAQDELVYVAVEPCRLGDTRATIGSIPANGTADFLAYGDSTAIGGQGGNPAGCAHPRTDSTPVAIAANFTAVGNQASGNGNLVAYAFGDTAPTASLVNYKVGTNIANSSIIALCEGGTCSSDFTVKSNNSAVPAIVDVQGYFYPLSGDDQVGAGIWEGTGQGIYPDGTTSQITDVSANLAQEGNFIYGTAQFTLTVGNNDPVVQVGQLSGHIQGNAVKGLFGGCLGPAPDCVGGAIFEGKLTGDELFGTVLDLGDGSTGTLTLQRTSP